MAVPIDISDQEKLARGIFSESIAKRAHRKIPKTVFLEKRGEKNLSVDRIDVASSIDILVEISDKIAKNRQRPFCGWAVIIAENASDNGREVLSTPLQDNPYHADIILPDAAVIEREEQKTHAQQLADKATWRERP